MSSKVKNESVTIKTFKKWSVCSHFEYDLGEDNKIEKLRCKTCNEYWNEIQTEAKKRGLRGAVLDGVKQYIDGVTYVHKANVDRHCKPGSLHEHACNLKLRLAPKTTGPSGDVEPKSGISKIGSMFLASSTDTYSKLFRTALFIVLKEEPLSKFASFVELQITNGLKLFVGKTSRNACIEMIACIAAIIREDITELLRNSHFMSGLCDGSEARKTREEKELVYVKTVKNGVPIYLLLKCQRMKDFGGTDASALQRAFLESFTIYGVDFTGSDASKIVSVCADGASVNMGKRTGAIVTLKRDIPSLLVIHCSLHKFELAIADAFKKSKEFGDIDEIMLSLYLLFKHSGKNWRMLMLLAERMGVKVLRYPKTSGTRFQAHKQRGLQVLLFNFCVFLMLAENVAETSGLVTPAMKTKIGGFYKKMLKYKFIMCVSLYQEVLEQTAKVSLVMETENSLITDILDVLDVCTEKLENIVNRAEKMPEVIGSFTCRKDTSDDTDSVILTATATSLPSRLTKEASKLTDRQRETLSQKIVKEVAHNQEFKLTNVISAEKEAVAMKEALAGEIKECVTSRFATLKADGVISAMVIVDHTRWDISDELYGMENIHKLSEHFANQLSSNDYNITHAKSEFVELKKLQQKRYPSIQNKTVFWQKIFTYHQDSFQNILLIIEICLCTAWAQGTVERGFSVVRRLITEQRTNLTNETLDNLLVIRLNLHIMGKFLAEGDYEESVIQRAVNKYLVAKKWRWDLKAATPDHPSAMSAGDGPSASKKHKCDVEVLSDSESQLSSSDQEDSCDCLSDEEDDDTLNG